METVLLGPPGTVLSVAANPRATALYFIEHYLFCTLIGAAELIRNFSRSKSYELATPLVPALGCLVVYCLTLAPTVTSEDSGELIAAAHVFGIPHPPGYPLWTILCGSFLRVFGFGEVAWRANMFSALCAAACIGVLCSILRNLGVQRIIAISIALAVGFGRSYWSQGVIAEVYALHGLLFVILLWTILKWKDTGHQVWLVVASSLVGLGMTNHHLTGISAVGLAAWVIVQRPKLLLRIKLVLACMVAFTASLAPYAYLPLRAPTNPAVNWGNPSTMSTFLAHVNRKQYKRSKPATNRESVSPIRNEMRQVGVIAGYCANEHTRGLFAVTIVGFFCLVVRHRALAILFTCVTLSNIGLFLVLHGIGEARQDIWSSRVFFGTQQLLQSIPLAFGLQTIVFAIKRRAEMMNFGDMLHRTRSLLGLTPLLIALVPLQQHWHENNFRNYWYAHDHATNMLASMLPNALVIPSGDHNTFPLVYLTVVQGVRPDVTIADKYGYIEPSLYQNMPVYKGRKPRTRAERDEIEEWLVRTARRPVYYTVKKPPLVPNAKPVPVGVLYHLLPNGKSVDLDAPWRLIHYRNLSLDFRASQDFGADNILADYFFAIAVANLEKGQSQRALDAFADCARNGEGIREVFNNIGCALSEYGFPDHAVRYFDKAIEADGKYSSAYWNLARLHKATKNWQMAEATFQALEGVTPDDHRVPGELGFLALRTDTPIEIAIARFERSLHLNPKQPQIVTALADYYRIHNAGGNAGATRYDSPGTTTMNQRLNRRHLSGPDAQEEFTRRAAGLLPYR